MDIEEKYFFLYMTTHRHTHNCESYTESHKPNSKQNRFSCDFIFYMYADLAGL